MEIPLATVAAAAGLVGLALGPMASRYLAQRRLARICGHRRVLVLTYDDGPGAEATLRLLDLLASHGARASFFVLGSKAEALPAILDRTIRDGHEIGSHSYGHAHAWKSPWRAVGDVVRGFRTTSRWLPSDGLFRPPYGKLTPITWMVVRLRGARFAWWTHDSGDTWESLPPMDEMVEGVRRSGGGVVLLHDFDREEPRARWALEATQRLLAMAKSEGLRVLPLGELLRAERGGGR